MKNKIIMIPLFILIVIGTIHQIMFSITPLREVPELMSSVRAKEFCSCYFMLNKGKEYCLKSVKKGYPFFDYTINDERKSIHFKNPIAEASARVLNNKYGCSLE